MAGTGEVIHSGAFIDVTEGVEIPSGSKLTPGHRYLAGEDTSAVISVRSGAMYLGLQGSYGYEPGGGDPMPFVDVAQGDWFQSAVEYVYGNGLFSGMSADRFSPGTTMNRAMLVTVFYRLAGSPEGELNAADASFTDVADGSWYAPFVRWGYVQGVTARHGGWEFRPGAERHPAADPGDAPQLCPAVSEADPHRHGGPVHLWGRRTGGRLGPGRSLLGSVGGADRSVG